MFITKNIDDCLELIKNEYARKDDIINSLRQENEKLKYEAYKDVELERMKKELEEMKADYYRGFPISEKEEKAIEAWTKKHDEEAHGLTTNYARMKAGGVSGGRFSYHFVPTGLGTFGVIRCSCGAEFEFQEIG